VFCQPRLVPLNDVSQGIAIGNFLVAGSLYSHTAAKLVFVRLFRRSHHLYNHTLLGWLVWSSLCLAAVAVAFLLAVAVPIFPYLISIAAALFASWYTYGLAGFFWLHDAKGVRSSHPFQSLLAVLTVGAGAFICVAGTFVSVVVGFITFDYGSCRV
jgi:hypothetical protein